jgi:hypothetical protein
MPHKPALSVARFGISGIFEDYNGIFRELPVDLNPNRVLLSCLYLAEISHCSSFVYCG